MPEPAPTRLFAFKLIVSSLEAMEAFYKETFGFEKTGAVETDAILETLMRAPGDAQAPLLVLYKHKDGRALNVGNAHGPIVLAVADVDRFYAAALANGATPSRPPFDTPTARVGFVFDPEGHEIELLHFASPA
ncbi:MAG: VOC family protein [Hyphomonadaceae bacterium]